MSKTDETPPAPRHPDLTLADLTDALYWPRLFQAARLALAPGRILLALVTIVAVGLIGSISLLWHNAPSFGQELGIILSGLADAIWNWINSLSLARPWVLNLDPLVLSLGDLADAASNLLLGVFPASSIILGVPMLAVALIGWAAIARSAAWEFGLGATETSPVLLAKAVHRLPSIAGAVIGLPLFALVVALGMGIIGWLVLAFPLINIIGALLFGLSLLVALVLVPLIAAWAVGFPLIAPAVMAEGPDAFDALQRAMAYVINRPLRYLIYFITLVAIGVVVTILIRMLLVGADSFATAATAMFLTADDARILNQTAPEQSTLEGTAVAAAHIVSLFRSVLSIIGMAFVFSYFASASSVLYLTMRSLVDGQDIGDLAAEID